MRSCDNSFATGDDYREKIGTADCISLVHNYSNCVITIGV